MPITYLAGRVANVKLKWLRERNAKAEPNPLIPKQINHFGTSKMMDKDDRLCVFLMTRGVHEFYRGFGGFDPVDQHMG